MMVPPTGALLTGLFIIFSFMGFSVTHPLFNRGTFHPVCLDVAIVGGGIGGTYTGWRLRDRGLKVAIFENTDRIGGRMLTLTLPSIPNTPVELGAMRYLPVYHTTLANLMSVLGLQTEVFKPSRYSSMYYLRGTLMKPEELNSSKLPYNLAPGESRDLGELRWLLAQRVFNMTEPDKIPDVEEAVTSDGVPLYKQGFVNMLSEHLSNEAREYITHVIPWQTLFGRNNNAMQGILAGNPTRTVTPAERRTVVGGMNQVSRRLAEQFASVSYSQSVSLNRRVDSIRKMWNGERYVYKLTMYETQTVDGFTQDKTVRPYTVCANQVILALPPQALKNIHWYPLQNDLMKTAFDAISDASAMKIFLVYENAWWDNLKINNNSFVSDLPIRRNVEFGRYRNSSGHEVAMMMVSYADGDMNMAFWRQLRRFPDESISSSAVPRAYSVDVKVVQHVHRDLAVLYDVSPGVLPWPIDGAMHIWNDPQNGGAWQTYNPGYKPKEILQIVAKPSPYDQVFVVTNGFSRTLSTWSEGALRAADDVLMKYFNVS